jgi:serine phosphatase RsbU (regulator of sigma subunit)
LKDHFLYFKPRDFVSGDFYWIDEHKEKIIVAVADCTGHGVPGAFVSVLGISFLNEIIQTFRRYNYEIISDHQEDSYLLNLKERSDYLDKYLNI